MILALDGTAISIALIAGLVTLIGAWIGIVPALKKLSLDVRNLDTANASQHGEVAGLVQRMDRTLKDVDATLGLLVTTQGFPLFKNTPEGHLIWANSAALELLGLSFDELSDPSVWPRVVHPEDRERVIAIWNKQVSDGRPAPAIIFRYVHPVDGDVIHVRGLSRPIFDADGSVREWVSMVVPLTQHEETHHGE